MRYAIKNGKRVEATESGEVAKCSACKGDVKAYCGHIVVWHWKHISKEECDIWWEPETEWHRNWKDNFPKEWQEIVHFDEMSGEKHVVDIKTDKGTVIEFQNSPLSIDELRQREFFYKELVWVVNAEKFKDHFVMTSKVKKNLRIIEENYRYRLKQIEDDFEDVAKDQKKVVENKSNGLKLLQRNFDIKKDEAEEYRKYKLNYNEISSDIAYKISKGRYYSNWDMRGFVDEIEKNHEDELKIIFKLQNELTEELQELSDKIKTIDNLEHCEYKGNLYKSIPSDSIDLTDYSKIFFIEKRSLELNSLFPPDLEKATYEFQFETILRAYENYKFYFDFQEELITLKNKQNYLKQDIAKCKDRFENELKNISIKLDKWLSDKINKMDEKIHDIGSEIEVLSSELSCEQERLNNLRIEAQSEKRAQLDELKKQKEREKYRSMIENKGQYIFDWKYARKVWLEASCDVFFDTGEDYLFHRVNSSLLEKILKKKFVSFYL